MMTESGGTPYAGGQPGHRWTSYAPRKMPKAMMSERERLGKDHVPKLSGGIVCADCRHAWPGDAPCAGVPRLT